MQLNPLSDEDGSWAALKSTWRKECLLHSEDFDSYAQGTFSVLDPLAAQGHARAGIYGLDVNGSVGVFCHANRTTLPHSGPGLRVRFTTFAPRYDCGDFDENEYARLIVELFFGVVELSNGPMEAEHIKFHLRSLADKSFFAALHHFTLPEGKLFQRVEFRGMWMLVTKA
jgi:hypothetical protein